MFVATRKNRQLKREEGPGQTRKVTTPRSERGGRVRSDSEGAAGEDREETWECNAGRAKRREFFRSGAWPRVSNAVESRMQMRQPWFRGY